MIKIYKEQVFDDLHDRNSRKLFSDYEFYNCQFQSCTLSTTKNPKKRTLVRNVKLVHCKTSASWIDTAVLEDILVDGFKTYRLFHSWGAVFKHVTIRGNIGRIMISPMVDMAMAKLKVQKAFDEANAAYYGTVDWALDIREARFYECEIQRIPAGLIKHDPETQAIVTREKAVEGKWKTIDLSKTYWATTIQFMLNRGDADVVLVAPKRHPKYLDYLEGIKKLRDIGVAEPD